MLCTVLFKSGHSAVVRYLEGKDHRAVVLPAYHVAGSNMGTTVDLAPEIVAAGIEYGLDFELFVREGGVIIQPLDLQNAMRAHGIWTFEDLKNKPHEALAAILSLARGAYESMSQSARAVYGG